MAPSVRCTRCWASPCAGACASTRSGPSRSRDELAAGQAEDALGDDVSLDLRRPARDRAGERAQVLDAPRSLAPRGWAGPRQVDGIRAEGLDADQAQLAL